jgi:cell division ATPase FtsA
LTLTVASSDAVFSPGRKEAGVTLIDAGGGTTDLAILERNHTSYCSNPFGGNVDF